MVYYIIGEYENSKKSRERALEINLWFDEMDTKESFENISPVSNKLVSRKSKTYVIKTY